MFSTMFVDLHTSR